jgi:hypothetical protein
MNGCGLAAGRRCAFPAASVDAATPVSFDIAAQR